MMKEPMIKRVRLSGNNSIRVEASRQKWFAIEAEVNPDEGITLHLALPYLFTLFLTFDFWSLKRWLWKRINCKHSTGVYISAEIIRIEWWQNQNDWKRGDWHWVWLTPDVLFGRAVYNSDKQTTYQIDVVLPDGLHFCEVVEQLDTWTYPRFKKPEVMRRFEFTFTPDVPLGIGKYGQDGMGSIIVPADTFDKAYVKVVDEIQRERDKNYFYVDGES